MTFEELANLLEVEGFEESASEIHGLLCGRIAGGERIPPEKFQSVLVECLDSEEELVENALDSLQALYGSIIKAFEDADFSFHPSLPPDDQPLGERVVALSEWCESFLSGLGDAGLASQASLSEDVTEAIKDLAAIAQVGFDAQDGDESDEADFFELEEYVRMAALMLFAELNPDELSPRPPSQTLH